MGDLLLCGTLFFNVLEVEYRSQLGEGPTARIPENTFIVILLQTSTGAGGAVPYPLMVMQSEGGTMYKELDDAKELPGWLGLIRRVEAGTTETGWMVFDAPVGNYGLRLTDGQLDQEHALYVRVPLQVGTELR